MTVSARTSMQRSLEARGLLKTYWRELSGSLARNHTIFCSGKSFFPTGDCSTVCHWLTTDAHRRADINLHVQMHKLAVH